MDTNKYELIKDKISIIRNNKFITTLNLYDKKTQILLHTFKSWYKTRPLNDEEISEFKRPELVSAISEIDETLHERIKDYIKKYEDIKTGTN